MELPPINFIAVLVAGLIPSILGALWYGPLFEKPWLSSLGKTKAEMAPNNMALTYGLALLMAMIVSFFLKLGIEISHRDVEAGKLVFTSFHTFKHGALHGAMVALTTVVPVIVSMSLFQKNSAKNILLNITFWTVCFSIMMGILDAWN